MRAVLLVSLIAMLLGCSSGDGPAATTLPSDDAAADASAGAEVTTVDGATEAAAEVLAPGSGGSPGGAGGVQAHDAGPAGSGGAGGAQAGSGGTPGGSGGVPGSGGAGGAPGYPACTLPTGTNWVPCAAKPDPQTGFSDRTYSKIGHLPCVLCTGSNVVDCVAIGPTLCVRSCGEGNCE